MADKKTSNEEVIRTIVAHPFAALAKQHGWDDAMQAQCRILIDMTVIRLTEQLPFSGDSATDEAPQSSGPTPSTFVQVNHLPLVRQVAAQHPGLLQTNTAATCHEFTKLVLARLKAEGYEGWGFVGKTNGEGQYRPPVGFPRQVGPHTITGVSHDAIASPSQRVDVLGGGNDGAEPLGTPAEPQWLDIPREHWRPNNPVLPFDGATLPSPPPIVTPPSKPYPGDAYFIEHVGTALVADYGEAGQTLNAGSVIWVSRAIWRYVNESLAIEQITAQSRKEWRTALGLRP